MDGALSFAWRSQTEFPGGYQQGSLLLLRLWPRRGRDSLRGTLSPGEVLRSLGVTAPMAWGRVFLVARSRTFLSHSATPPQRGGCLSVPTWSPFLADDRAHADRLRTRRLPARLADAVGSLFAGPASSRSGARSGIRRLRAAYRLSAGRQSLWPQPVGCGTAAPVLTGP